MFLKFKTFSRCLFLRYDIVYFIFEFLLIIKYIIWLNIGVPNKKNLLLSLLLLSSLLCYLINNWIIKYIIRDEWNFTSKELQRFIC